VKKLVSKCCGAELAATIEWLGADYRYTKDAWILVKHICNQCRKPCEVEEKEGNAKFIFN